MPWKWLLMIVIFILTTLTYFAQAISTERIAQLRSDTRELFYHGYDNYMLHAFPEDELKPITCQPLTRKDNPSDVGVNDVLGNYSLTLIDSLSTLAILASAPEGEEDIGKEALKDFQEGVELLVELYGDGTSGKSGFGTRARGFDLDSKVQVFETVIRGVGGLLSAHQFAVGDLPIAGYDAKSNTSQIWQNSLGQTHAFWPNEFVYNGQLLRLALNLAERLLPAFYSNTGLPYPRVNLRRGVPFYEHSPMHQLVEGSNYVDDDFYERTETCSAGAGSLVLEFTVLSRLTGDSRFEQVSKRAFWAVWSARRIATGLVGDGIDAQTGDWQESYSMIGAGIDSFFEYAFKAHVLLSGLPDWNEHASTEVSTYLEDYHSAHNREGTLHPEWLHPPLAKDLHSPASFLAVWKESHAAINKHVKKTIPYTHYKVVHLDSAVVMFPWIDSLSAYYPGLLALAGETEEAVAAHLLYAALWTRYSALPERWSSESKEIYGGMDWWPGRPEFIESNYHIYRATEDPWYLHVGEMALMDIKRRCWTQCGWAGLQNAKTGEHKDRMESFFLGETAKYLYLLFDSDHPLNILDAPYIFTTEGHPLIIPRDAYGNRTRSISSKGNSNIATCPIAPPKSLFNPSDVLDRDDYFHAAFMVDLHNYQDTSTNINGTVDEDNASDEDDEVNDIISEDFITKIESSILGNPFSKNHTFYPYTLPASLRPLNGTCSTIPYINNIRIRFPPLYTSTDFGHSGVPQAQHYPRNPLKMVSPGYLIVDTSDLELIMIEDDRKLHMPEMFGHLKKWWRVQNVAGFPIGISQLVFVKREALQEMVDPGFRKVKMLTMVDLVIQFELKATKITKGGVEDADEELIVDEKRMKEETITITDLQDLPVPMASLVPEQDNRQFDAEGLLRAFRDNVMDMLPDLITPLTAQQKHKTTSKFDHTVLVANTATGPGAAPLPEVEDAPYIGDIDPHATTSLSWKSVYFVEDEDRLCTHRLPDEVMRNFNIVVVKRGGCSFSEKLANIPAFTPKKEKGFQLLLIVSTDDVEDDLASYQGQEEEDADLEDKQEKLVYMNIDKPGIRPLLDQEQRTPSGMPRRYQIPVLLVGGGEESWELLKKAKGLGIRRKYYVESFGHIVGNMGVL